ncbi:MAG: tetratricopeptide repeat protein [Sphaerochaetaceae bacterium]|nr:tetratricopeptide repeat protein [Sphaerochaetaceae bacterium]
MKKTMSIYQDKNKNIVDAQLYAELQQKAFWRQEEKVALFNALGPLHPGTIEATLRLAEARMLLGDVGGALEYTKEAYQARCKVFGEYHKDTVDAYLTLADAYLNAEQPLEAKNIAQDVLRDDYPYDPDDLVVELDAKEILADAHQMLREFGAETKVRRELVADMEEIYGPNHPETLGSIETLAESLDENGCPAQAIPLYERLLSYMREEKNMEGVVMILCNLATCCQHVGQQGKALAFAEEAVRISKQTFGDDDDLTQTAIGYLGEITEDNRFFSTKR